MMQTLAAVRIGLMRMRLVDGTGLSYQLMVMGGGLLIVAAVLMAVQRKASHKTPISRESSLSMQELKIYLLRIANALERMERPHAGEEPANMLRRLEEMAHARASGKLREMPKYRSK